MTKNSKKAILVSTKELKQMIYIQYPIVFLESITKDNLALNLVLALFDLSGEINVIHLTFAKKLGLII